MYQFIQMELAWEIRPWRLRDYLSPIACLLLVITAILGVGYSSAQAQAPGPARPTPYLVFSTYLGGTTPFASGYSPLTFAQNCRQRRPGEYLRDRRHPRSPIFPCLRMPSNRTPRADSTMSAFVAKYNPAGQLLWCTYLGGNQQSMGVGVAAMPDWRRGGRGPHHFRCLVPHHKRLPGAEQRELGLLRDRI